ncbi:hypothetical protein CPB83DRAFT_784718 [Crepidotus variabilis]|uniref:UDENN domain-containing protein n=1 Tax=Crepidotus variabilis TaxID=179855 RepID=A0A9P6JU65_9AGAR|nr:hypothetical protein CPB83DRAFT_784718 [Crepidotus variabilis]
MPPNIPAKLNLDPPEYEEDIGDLSPYAALPLTTSTTSTTLGSSISGFSPRSYREEDGHDSDIPQSAHDEYATIRTPKKGAFGTQLHSPSSPSLVKPSPTRRVSRSQTLPRGFNTDKTPRKVQTEISALDIDLTAVTKMRRWILGIAVVEFDIDTGPTVDAVYPPLTLSPTELETLAFCAFPDSLQFDQGSQIHSFRLRERTSSTPPNDRPKTQDGFIYGYSHFMQKRDSTSKRGYQQRSLVILTQHQFPALFSSLITIFGPLFEKHGTPMLEAACYNTATWSNPDPGETIELGFLGSVLHVEIPSSVDAQQLTETSSFNEKYDPRSHILAATSPFLPPPILLFEAALANLWSIWECLILCEPILVFGQSPAQTSQAIWWLRDLLRPIPLAGDIRPYFTLQDSDAPQLVNRLPPKAGLLIGVTNPFFEKSCIHWPHVLSLGRRFSTSNTPRLTPKSPTVGISAGPAPGWKTKTHKRYISKDRVLLKQLENALRGDDRARMDASLALRRHFCSRTTQVITPLARYLNTLIPSPVEVHRARQALVYAPLSSSASSLFPSPSVSRTSLFPSSPTPSVPGSASSASSLASPMITPSSSISPAGSRSSLGLGLTPTNEKSPDSPMSATVTPTATRTVPGLRLKAFNNANFFTSLKAHGSILPFKSTSKRTEFYERWLKSPAFGAWLAQQEQIVQNVLNEPRPHLPGAKSGR